MFKDSQPRTCGILLSGGIDSAVSLAIARDLGWEIAKVFYIDYGQKFFDRELRSVVDIMKHYKIPLEKLHIGDIDLVPGNPVKKVDAFDEDSLLFDETVYEIKEMCAKDEIHPAGYTHVLPYRNALFLLYVASILQQEIDRNYTIIIGTNWGVKHPCEDESPKFIGQVEDIIETCAEDGFQDMEIISFGELDWNGNGEGIEGALRAGIKLKVPFQFTTSCDNYFFYNCGICASCVARMQEFEKVKMFDPAPYYDFDSRMRLAPWLQQTNPIPYIVNKRTVPYTIKERIKNFLGMRV